MKEGRKDRRDRPRGGLPPDAEGGVRRPRRTRRHREAKFRVHNWSKTDRKVGWFVNGDEQGGKLTVDGRDSATFWVTVLDDQKTPVSVTCDGDVVDTEKVDTETSCSDDHCDA